MKLSLQQALDNTETTYKELSDIANDMTGPYVADVNKLIQEATNNIENLTNDSLRTLMLKLSLKSYSFGDIKDKSSLKYECAEALRKEAYARNYNKAEGKLGEKENVALLESSNEVMVEAIYSLVASLFKTKLDEIHRVVDTLKTILMSRMAEAKLLQNEGVE